jgi:hypothetical protein
VGCGVHVNGDFGGDEFPLQINPPDLIDRPDLPPDSDILMIFHQPIDAISAGENAVERGLARILELIIG